MPQIFWGGKHRIALVAPAGGGREAARAACDHRLGASDFHVENRRVGFRVVVLHKLYGEWLVEPADLAERERSSG